MKLDAQALGVEGTVDQLRQLLVAKFDVATSTDVIDPREPLFAAGVGLSSMEGMELLLEIERVFDVEIDDVEAWMDDSPTLLRVAEYVVDRSQRGSSHMPEGLGRPGMGSQGMGGVDRPR